MNPEIALDRKNCTRCGRCLVGCPSNAIILENDAIGIRRDRCDNCGKCSEACPTNALKLLGQYWSIEELVAEVQKDAVLFKHSGGGVTISGGEPLLEPDFARRLLAALKGKGISTGVDTSGYVPWATIEYVLPYVDFFLWDIKQMDSDRHLELTRVPNEFILDNARRASDRGLPLYIRVPVIPGYNDSEDNIRATCEFTRSLRSVIEVHLLPFHHLGRARYESLDRSYPLEGTSLIADDAMQRMQLCVESYGLKCRIGG